MFRIIIAVILTLIGFMFPSWLYLVVLFGSALFLRNFWVGIFVGVILDIAYTHAGVDFSAKYILWGVGAFALSFMVYNMTRLRDKKD